MADEVERAAEPSGGEDVRSFFADKRREIAGRALMTYPQPAADEAAGVAVWARLLHLLEAPVLIRHPYVPLRIELSRAIGPRLAYLMSVGDYELGDLELLGRHVQPGDQVLELGGGAGLTAAMSAVRSGRPVVVVDANAALFPVIRRQVELNGGSVVLEHGAVMGASRGSTVEFYVDEELWFSSTAPRVAAIGERPRVPVEVPVLALGDLLVRHRPTVLMVDIEGAEREVFVSPLPHRPTTILVEIDAPIYGEREAAAVVQRIIDHGYRFVDQSGWTYVFHDARGTAVP
jgi:FkbM family methyltransferase